MAYILIGTPLATFHGDEATQIMMSRDYAYQFIERNLDRVRYHNPPRTPDEAAEQPLRLINGTINKYAIGLAWHVAGFSASDLNEQWDWGADWNYNQANNHAPSAALLVAARWPSAIFLALGVPLIYAVTRAAGGGALAGLIAALLYTLSPALLLNGRRAMMEGSLTFFTLLTVWLCGRWLYPREPSRGARSISWGAAFGAAGGLALAAKHTAAFAVIPLFVFAVIVLAWRAWQARSARAWGVASLSIVAAGAASATIFLLLNPAWWDDPIRAAGEVLRLRSDLLAGQMAAFGGYTGVGEAFNGYGRQVFVPHPQYFEVAGWEAWIGDQIAAYEASGLAGVITRMNPAIAITLLTASFFGLACLIDLVRRAPSRAAIAVWIVSAIGLTLLLTPIEWARYYLPVLPPIAVLLALAAESSLAWRKAINSKALRRKRSTEY